MNCRFFLGVLVLTTASCSSNAPTSSADPGEQAREETSWHCEESGGAWSCKRRTIAEIQRLEAASQARKFDWSMSEDDADTPAEAGDSSQRTLEAAASAIATTPPETPTKTRPSTSANPTRQAQSPPTAAPDTASASATVLAEQETAPYQRLMYRPDAPMSLEELPSSYWTLQLIALSSARELQGFISTLELDGLIGAMIKTNDRLYYVALLGVYETRAAAELAAKERPASLSRYEPYIRSLGSLQAAMAQANQLPR